MLFTGNRNVGSNPTLSVRRDCSMDKNLEDVWYETRIATALAVASIVMGLINTVMLYIALFIIP